MKLNERQTRFADEYIRLGEAAQAAVNAGYSIKTARYMGYENLNKPHIKAYIATRLEELRKESIAEQDEILQFLTSVARGQIQASVLIGTGGGAERITNDMPPTMAERVKAAELLGKRYAMWTDRQQVESITPIFVNDVPIDD